MSRKMMASLWQDLRYGIKLMRRNPGFSIVTVLMLALGIGINSSIFSVVNALLLQPMPFNDAERLVLLWNHYPGMNIPQDWLSPAEYVDFKTQGDLFEEIAIANGNAFNLNDGG